MQLATRDSIEADLQRQLEAILQSWRDKYRPGRPLPTEEEVAEDERDLFLWFIVALAPIYYAGSRQLIDEFATELPQGSLISHRDLQAASQRAAEERAAFVAEVMTQGTRERAADYRQTIEEATREAAAATDALSRGAFVVVARKASEALEWEFSRERAEAVAITETTVGQTGGQHIGREVMRERGVILDAQWIAENDARTCKICIGLDGKDESDWPEKYRDGPPAHVACVLPGNLVTPLGASFSAGAKSLFVGRCVEATLANGCRFTVTENHPVLTSRGFLAAKLLEKGTKVMHASNAQRVSSLISPDYDDCPTAVEEVFRSLVVAGGVQARGVPVTAVNLHGDERFMHGQVDVVTARRLLRRHFQVGRYQSVPKPLLIDCQAAIPFPGESHLSLLGKGFRSTSRRSMCSRGHVLPLLGGSPLPASQHRVTDTAGLDSGSFKSLPKGTAGHAHFSGQRLLCFSGNVSGHKRLEVRNDSAELTMPRNAAPANDGIHAGSRKARLAGKFIECFSNEVSPHDVVSVRSFHFSGHVYDLQCDPFELYAIGSGAIIANCRCHVQYTPESETIAEEANT